MSKAIGMIEFKTTATGVTAADAMVKTSEVEIIEAQTVCPGKYIAIITGDLSAVKAAVDAAVTTYEDKCMKSVHWEFWKPMMRLLSLRLQIRQRKQQSLI